MLRKLFLVVVAVFPALLSAAENGDILSKNAAFTTSVQKIADADFRSLYRRSVEQYVESFIARNELYERTVETADSFESEATIPNPSAVICRDKVNTLVSAADCFIPVWTENCGSGINGETLKFNMWLISNHADLLQKTLLFNREDKE